MYNIFPKNAELTKSQIEVLESEPNVIIYGAASSGKTFFTILLAEKLIKFNPYATIEILVFTKALAEMNNNHFNGKEWLINNFELYKLTLNWPNNLAPIKRSNLLKGTLREKFNSTYSETLSEFDYELNNEKRTLKIKYPFLISSLIWSFFRSKIHINLKNK